MNNQISFFRSIKDKQPTTINFSQTIQEIRVGKYSDIILKIRSTEQKQERDALKKTLPCVTVSGEFKDGHSLKNLIAHSGMLQVDIDNLSNPEEIKKILSKDKYTYSSFISPSGNGVKVIVKIDHENHLECFNSIKEYYSETYKIKIDESCKDVNRLMYLSYDTTIFLNENSMVLDITKIKVENIILNLENSKQDITEPYQNYLNIGFALADQFNEDGRSFYHRVSRISSKYDSNKCDIQFTECLKSRKDGIKIGTFFYIAKQLNLSASEKTSLNPNASLKGEKKKSSNMKIVKNYIAGKYDLRLNLVSNEIACKMKNETIYKLLNENNLYIELLSNNYSFSQANLTALLRSDFVKTYDPIKNYFEGLQEWNQTTDYIKDLCQYIKVKDPIRFEKHLKKALVRCIACSLYGYFNKHAFVLIGGQSSGKTYFTRWLCPDPLKDYITENINTDKDSLIALSENFFIILDELASLAKNEINALKSIFTKDRVKVRRPYDKKATSTIRRANFFGSTNKEEFLSDETGSVRWLCFKIESIDFDYSKLINKDCIWSQAYHLYNNGFEYELTREERLENEIINATHQNSTQEIELIQLHYQPSSEALGGKFVAATDILNNLNSRYGFGIRITNIGIGKALTFLNFERVSRKPENGLYAIKGYYVLENL